MRTRVKQGLIVVKLPDDSPVVTTEAVRHLDADSAAISVRWGLCATCAHAIVIASDKGSTFVQCARAKDDTRYRRYPVVPVVRCDGHQGKPSPGTPSQGTP